MRRHFGGALLLLAAGAGTAGAQGYRLRLDTRFQSVSFRGIAYDSVLASQVVTSPGAGPMTPDGYLADCRIPTTGYCYYFRPGAKLQGQPLSSTADLTMWGFGLRGLTFRASGRLATDLTNDATWPGAEPEAILTEAYAEYAASAVSARLGRQLVTGRLGYQGFDGALATVRLPRLGLELTGYGGSGLARAVALPVTSPALNPLNDFQPRDRQVLVGGSAAFRHRYFDLTAEYRREVDPAVDYFVSERAGASAVVHPMRRVELTGGAEYDFANGWWGSAEAGVRYNGNRVTVSAQGLRYRPFFDLWTIWGAFSPVPYRSARGDVAVEPVKGLWVRAGGERYWFDPDEADTPLSTAEDRGWRANLSAAATVVPSLTIEGGLRSEFGPGASSRTIDLGATWRPTDRLTLVGRLGTLDRPLEFRYSDAKVHWVSGMADLQLTERLRLVSDLGYYQEDRQRPDAAAFNLDQLRLSTRFVMTFGSGADRLPKGRPRPAAPSGGAQ
ncbi:MAG: hypothetical protein AB7L66_11645 [Gemmatimonadales bacterium]